jgi:hypothetical protein
MNKKLYRNFHILLCLNLWFSKSFKIIFICINGITLQSKVLKNHSTKDFNKYNESIIIWYGLWCKVFGTSKVQYVIITQNLFMKFINVIISHVIYFFASFSHIVHLYFIPWPWLIIQQIVTRLCIPP